MQPITIIAIVNGASAVAFAALWWRNREFVEIAETARNRAASKADHDAFEIAHLRAKGRNAAETIAELQPLAEQARRAQAQRIAASKAAHAKRRERQVPPVDASAMPRRARRVGKAN